MEPREKKIDKDYLERVLQEVPEFPSPDLRLEQYSTPAWLASEMILYAYMRGDLEGVVADLGCGTGRISLGVSMFEPERVYCIDLSCRDLEIAVDYFRRYGRDGIVDIICWDISRDLDRLYVDTVVMNPPFGVHKRGYDMMFLDRAWRIARRSVYSIHKYNKRSIEIISREARSRGFETDIVGLYDMEIRASYFFHRRRVYRFRVALLYMRRSL